MIAARFIPLLALAACAQPQIAAAPKPAPAPQPAGPVARMDADGVIRVTAAIADEDALSPLHCAAARQATATGKAALEWVGGVASPRAGGGFDADMVYETAGAAKARGGDVRPADGGLVATGKWMTYCDAAEVQA